MKKLNITIIVITLVLGGAAVRPASAEIGGWTIGATSLTGGSTTLDSSGNVTVGTGDNVARLSSSDATYRLWVGHATAGSAPFRVTSAGAVTASNLTVTGGSISGATATFGGSVTLDSGGISITQGTSTVNRYKFSDGSFVGSTSTASLWLRGVGLTALESNGGTTQLILDSGALYGTGTFGRSANRWSDIYLANNLNWSNPPTTDVNDYPMVYSTTNTQLYRKTDGFDGTCSSPTSIVIERGIVVGCS